MYNMTNVTGATSFDGLVVSINDLSQGVFASTLLFVIFFIVYMVQIKNGEDAQDAVLAAITVVSFIGIFFVFVGLLSWVLVVELGLLIAIMYGLSRIIKQSR